MRHYVALYVKKIDQKRHKMNTLAGGERSEPPEWRNRKIEPLALLIFRWLTMFTPSYYTARSFIGAAFSCTPMLCVAL